MLNRIIVMGRLTRDPELRRTQSGISVTSFSVAVDRDFRTQSGERETDFIEVVAWRNTAEFVTKYFTKGRMAVVEGRLQIRDWTDREGQKRRSAEIVAENIYFGDSRRDNNNGEFGGASYGASPAGQPYGGSSSGGYGGSAYPSGGTSAPGYGSSYGGGSGYGSSGGSGYGSGSSGGSGYGSGSSGGSGYGSSSSGAPGYGSGSSGAPGYGSSSSGAPGYGSAPSYGPSSAPAYGSAEAPQSDFSELSEEEDGDLPF